MRRCRIDLPNRCCHLISRVAHRALEFGGLQAANRKGRYDKEKLLRQFTVAIKSGPVGSAKEAQVAVAALQASAQGEGCSGINAGLAYTVKHIQKGPTLLTIIGELLDMDRGSFMRAMRAGEARQQQHPTSGTSQFKSWRDCFKVLKSTFGKFKKSELPQWRELQIEFERILPNGRRPDVIIYSKRLVVVLEFKRMKDEFEGFVKQVRSYVKSLRAIEAEGMKRKVKGIIIYTEMETAHDIGRIQKCSADKLYDALLHLLGGSPEKE